MATLAATNYHYTPTTLTKSTPKWLHSKLHFLNFSNFPSLNKGIPLLQAHCSTRPNANRQKPTDGSSYASPNSPPSSGVQAQGNPNVSQSIRSNASTTRGLVFDLGPGGCWDSLEIGSPVVKRFIGDEEERWYMWYHGRSSENNPQFDSIGLAVSGNGVHWERGGQGVRQSADVGIVMSKSSDWWAFDTHGVRPSEVVIMSSSKVRAKSGVYWLYYTGYWSEKIESLDDGWEFKIQNPDSGYNGEILKSLPGLAMSQDGRHWARIEGEHHSGALLDVGSDGEWDSSFIASPQVFFHETGDIRMYYHSFDTQKGHFGIGLARSRDGMRWVKLGKILGTGGIDAFDERGTINPRVVRRKDGSYLMAYEGVGGNGRRSIGMAVSMDGLKQWKRVQEGRPVLEGSEVDGGWDSEGVGMPCLVEMDGGIGEWRMYYRGIGKEGRTGIGLAVCQGTDMSNFERWTGFHL